MVDRKPMRVLVTLVALLLVASACAGSGDALSQAASDAAALSEDGGESQSRQLGSAEDADTAETEALPSVADEPEAPSPESATESTESADQAATSEGDESAAAPVPAEENEPDAPQASEAAPAQNALDGPAEEPLDALVTELMAFVEAERGLAFVERPDVVVLNSGSFNDEWQEIVVREAQTNPADFANFSDIYQAVGIIDDGRELDEIWARFGDAGVVGYYDTETGNIVLRGGELTAFTETVLVHELVHALEDQVFGLDRGDSATGNDEIDWTFSALIEGSARVIEGRYRATLSRAELDEEAAARNSIPRSVSLNEFTPSFLELQFGRYDHGEDFAAALWDIGQDELDAAYTDPPTTSEAVVNPDAFLSGSDDVAALDFPPADGEIFEQGIWGQAGVAALLTDIFDRDEALEVSQGWGNDRFVAWSEGELSCVRIHLSADSPDDLDRYAEAFEDWAEVGDRQVFFPTADLIRVTSCG